MNKKKEILTNEIFTLMKLNDDEIAKIKEVYKAPKVIQQVHKDFDWNKLEERYNTLYND